MMTGLMVMGCALTARPIPADPQPKTVTQPDGSTITVVMRGDERAHALFDTQGQQLKLNRESGFLEVDATAPSWEQWSQAQRTQRAQRVKQSVGPRRLLINDFPAYGKQRTLVILISFSDVDFMSVDDPHEYFSNLLNQEGFTNDYGANGSARDFYVASSMGQFLPDFDVVGPVKLSHTAAYYGSDTPSQDAKMGEAVVEACQLADEVVDFSQYDANGDGYVDNIFFFYAGYGQADQPDGDDYIWPHSAHLEKTWDMSLECDGKKIGQYACSNEVRYSATGAINPSGIGTFVHEFGHVIGLADHYDVGYSLLTFNVGTWDTMASGSYNNNMNTPPLFSAFERAELGWLDYIELTTDADTLSVLPWLGTSNKAYRISVPGTNEREFFICENRQQTGWDKYLPGHGMVLWHIDIDTAAWNGNYVNYDYSHQRVDIVEVDGSLTDATRNGDCMPGASNVTAWDVTSWAGDKLLRLDDVSEVRDTIRILVGDSPYELPMPQLSLVEAQDSSLLFTWSEVPYARSYVINVTDAEGNAVGNFKEKSYFSADTVTVPNLVPLADYVITARAIQGSYVSETDTLSASTEDLIFAKRKTTVWATDTTTSGFTAHWDAIRDAKDYELWMWKLDYSDQTTTLGYDFSDKQNGLPDLWSTTSSSYYSVSGYYGKSSPSLRFANDGDQLIIAWNETVIDELTWWMRGKQATGKLIVEADHGDGNWVEVVQYTPSMTGQTLTLATGGAQRVRMRYERDGSWMVIDDVKATCRQMQRTLVSGYENGKRMGDVLEQAISGLSAGTYGFRISGLLDGVRSYLSDECVVTLGGSGLTGDVNGDGEVTIADVNAIVDLILSSSYSASADVNGDGEVTIADVNAVVDIILEAE